MLLFFNIFQNEEDGGKTGDRKAGSPKRPPVRRVSPRRKRLLKIDEKFLRKDCSVRWVQWVATGFGVGYLPLFPGTFGSLLGLFLFLPLRSLPPISYALFFLLFVGLGVYTSDACELLFRKKDAGEIIIDEIAAMLLVLPFLPASAGWWIAGFIAFRFFDIAKPAPIRTFEKLPGGWGVMADDLVAAGYAIILLRVGEAIFRKVTGG